MSKQGNRYAVCEFQIVQDLKKVRRVAPCHIAVDRSRTVHANLRV